jgi:hypothetical protein
MWDPLRIPLLFLSILSSPRYRLTSPASIPPHNPSAASPPEHLASLTRWIAAVESPHSWWLLNCTYQRTPIQLPIQSYSRRREHLPCHPRRTPRRADNIGGLPSSYCDRCGRFTFCLPVIITVCSNFIYSRVHWLPTIVVQRFCFAIVLFCPHTILTVSFWPQFFRSLWIDLASLKIESTL